MTQLTPVFKLTLLVSIGLHVVAIIQSGSLSPGHYPTENETRLSITLSPATENRTTSEPLPKKPPEKAPKSEPEPEPEPEPKPEPKPKPVKKPNRPVKTQTNEPSEEKPIRPFKEALPQEVEQQRKRSGNVRSGISADESYQSHLLRHLEQYQHYPFIARRRQLEGRASIRITVTDDGQLQDIECLEGNDLFCEAAIQAARKAQPFPPPPASLSSREFQYAMEYRLRN